MSLQDYQFIVLVRAFYKELHKMTSQALTDPYITSNAKRKEDAEELLREMCDLHIMLDEDIQVRS